MQLTFVLLAVSIATVWCPPITHRWRVPVPPWSIFFVAATISGLVSNVLMWPALIPLSVLLSASVLSQRATNKTPKAIFTVIAALTALGLALHAFPGFNNPVLFDNVRLSENAAPFTQYVNFDKGAAGLLLLAFYCQRVTSIENAQNVALLTVKAALLTTLAVMAYGLSVRYVDVALKLPPFAFTFLAINLLFTCVGEEAFFRGLLQERLSRALSSHRQWIAICVSTVLFGLTHFSGGLVYVVLATIAGLGYSLAYASTRRIEAAIFTHFALNAIHFLGFTYPHLTK